MNIEVLSDKIDKNKAKRIKEILYLRIQAEKNCDLCRIFYPMLCAHFEGFIKECSNYYVKYISSKAIAFSKLKTNFKAIYLRSDFDKIKESKNDHSRIPLIDLIRELEYKNFKIKVSGNNPIISTYGNPKPDNLECILNSLGICDDIFKTKEVFINNNLLKKRNAIVHGELQNIEYKEFYEESSIVIELINKFSALIIEAAEDQLYLKED